MSGCIVTQSTIMMCPHGVPVSAQPVPKGVTQVLASGMPVMTTADLYPIVGCPYNVSGAPTPCTTVQWTVAALKVFVRGAPALIYPGAQGMCVGSAPPAPPIVGAPQPKVWGT